MNTTNKTQFSLSRWTRTTFWGWMLGVVLILMLSSFLDSIGIEHMQFYLGIGMGAGVGLAQWLSLRRWHPVSLSWIWFSIIGMGIPFIIMDYLLPNLLEYKIPIAMASGSLCVGLLQSRLLTSPSSTTRWTIASFLGWTAGGLTVLLINYTMRLQPNASRIIILLLAVVNLVLILSGGIVLGVITGKAWKKILPAEEEYRNA